jgi:hypothetical protein
LNCEYWVIKYRHCASSFCSYLGKNVKKYQLKLHVKKSQCR